jgi:hypothetical protein
MILASVWQVRHADETDHGDIVVRQLGKSHVRHSRHVTRVENLQRCRCQTGVTVQNQMSLRCHPARSVASLLCQKTTPFDTEISAAPDRSAGVAVAAPLFALVAPTRCLAFMSRSCRQ